jgi:hypothetical protein
MQNITGLIATIKLKTPSPKTDQQKTGQGNQKMVRQVETPDLFSLKPGIFCVMDRWYLDFKHLHSSIRAPSLAS